MEASNLVWPEYLCFPLMQLPTHASIPELHSKPCDPYTNDLATIEGGGGVIHNLE